MANCDPIPTERLRYLIVDNVAVAFDIYFPQCGNRIGVGCSGGDEVDLEVGFLRLAIIVSGRGSQDQQTFPLTHPRMNTFAHGRAGVRAIISAIDKALDRWSSHAMWRLSSARVYFMIFYLVLIEKLAKRYVGRIVNPLGTGPVQPARLGEIVEQLVARSEKACMSCLLQSGRDISFHIVVRLVYIWESRHGNVAVLVYAGRDIEARCDLMRPSVLKSVAVCARGGFGHNSINLGMRQRYVQCREFSQAIDAKKGIATRATNLVEVEISCDNAPREAAEDDA